MLMRVLVLLMLVLGCSCATETPRRQVIFILLDAARADRISAYGYSRTTTPNLDRLATDGLIERGGGRLSLAWLDARVVEERFGRLLLIGFGAPSGSRGASFRLSQPGLTRASRSARVSRSRPPSPGRWSGSDAISSWGSGISPGAMQRSAMSAGSECSSASSW